VPPDIGPMEGFIAVTLGTCNNINEPLTVILRLLHSTYWWLCAKPKVI
jgi:hypothetical protein